MKFVFIGGAQRSGTTLLGSLLGAHSSCLCIPESQFKTDVYEHWRRIDHDAGIRAAFDLIRSHVRFKYWGLHMGSDMPQGITSYQELFLWLIRQYGEKTGKAKADICIDHTPLNIKYAEVLFQLFPDAKMIHLVRDGRAVAASIMPLDWGPNTIDRAALSWVKKIGRGLAAEATFGMRRVLRVRYEDLVTEPEKTLRTICAFIDIPYETAMSKGGGYLIPVYTAGQHELVGKGPVTARVEAWKRSLSRRQIEIFESIAGDILIALGYVPLLGTKASGVTLSEHLMFMLQDMYRRKFVNKYRRRSRVKSGVERAAEVFEKKKP